jgi:membrane protease YdiL (CAAX protease family)
MFWHFVFSTYGVDIENVEYLQWGATALTVLWVTKSVTSRSDSNVSLYLGRPIDSRSLPEISLIIGLALILGIGCWSILVLIEARANSNWTYTWWGLMTQTDFEKIRWVKSWLVANVISGVILVPITEEIIFRGLILRRLISKYNARTAIWLSSLIFALFHFDKSFIGSFFHGVIFAVLAIKFASLYVPMVVHGAYNLLVFFARTYFGYFLAVDKLKIESIAYWAPEIVCLALGIVFFTVYAGRACRAFAEHPS